MKTLSVQFKGQSHDLQLPKGTETTCADVQELIEQTLGVPKDAQRLFQKKKRLDMQQSAMLLRDVCDCSSTTGLYLMAGASAAQIEKMKHVQETVETEQRIRAKRSVINIAKRNQMIETQQAMSSNYRFHGIEVLNNFRDASKARDILNRLATDRGILAVMEKHKWSVGVLAEMYPEGKVGVDPVCVLGLNQNKGQKILLRLRTDDLLGFRKYLSIKKVLFHELTHNVHSEHDAKFYQLMSQVERECNELDWTNSGGAMVGGSASSIIADDEGDSPLRTGGNRLGGGKGVSRLLQTDIPTMKNPPLSNEMPQSATVACSIQTEITDCSAPETGKSVEQKKSDVAPFITPETREMDTLSVSEQVSAPQTPPATSSLSNEVEKMDVDEEFATLHMSERERRIHNAVCQLRKYHHVDAVEKAVSLLYKIVSNIILNPSLDKFRSIRKTNRLFAANVAQYPECLEFLQAVGFEDQNESYVLVREDAALLWFGQSSLEVLLSTQA